MKTEPTCPNHPDRKGAMDGLCAECYFERLKRGREKDKGDKTDAQRNAEWADEARWLRMAGILK